MERPALTLSATVLDAPDPRALARFYQHLFGWPVAQDDPTWVTLRPPGGGPGLSFQLEELYERPTWPSERERQQMQLHLDIEVDDLAAAGALAEDAGAERVGGHTDEHEDVRVYRDPAGHPFCLFVRS